MRLIFVGPCDDKEYWDELQVIQKNIPQHIQIEFLGLVNDVEELIKLYSNANLFWFASKKEGMGNAVAESLFCGTPVITLPVMGIMKGVITNNEGGEVIDTEDPQVFAAAAMRWLQKPINREAIAKSAQEQFNAERVDLQYMIRIEKLLKQRHKNRPVPAKKFSTSYRLAGIITTLKHFQNIRQRQLDSPEQLRDHQFQCLRVTLKLAFEYIPYYREAYKKVGLVYDDIRTWQDFEKLPILTKTEKRAQPPEAFLPEGIKKELAWTTQTTGSSGIPITIYRNQDSAAKDRALMHYCYSALGIKIYHRFCQLSAVIPDKPNRPGPLARLGLKRSFLLDLRQNESELVRQMNQIKPDVIYGFPSVLLRLAEQIQSQPIQFKTRWIITQGEVLPEPWRATIQQAFSAPVYHTYGATELARVGFECKKQNGYHLISDAAIVEVISDGMKAKTGEEGDLIVTNLNNFISPLIRYEIGDRGILGASACPCGIHYPMLEKVVGRMDDFMILPSGRKVSARAVTHMQFRGILQYKIIQKSPQNFCVLVVPSADFTEQTSSEIRHELISGCLNENIQIEILPVESLPVSRTGKLQIVSREF